MKTNAALVLSLTSYDGTSLGQTTVMADDFDDEAPTLVRAIDSDEEEIVLSLDDLDEVDPDEVELDLSELSVTSDVELKFDFSDDTDADAIYRATEDDLFIQKVQAENAGLDTHWHVMVLEALKTRPNHQAV